MVSKVITKGIKLLKGQFDKHVGNIITLKGEVDQNCLRLLTFFFSFLCNLGNFYHKKINII